MKNIIDSGLGNIGRVEVYDGPGGTFRYGTGNEQVKLDFINLAQAEKTYVMTQDRDQARVKQKRETLAELREQVSKMKFSAYQNFVVCEHPDRINSYTLVEMMTTAFIRQIKTPGAIDFSTLLSQGELSRYCSYLATKPSSEMIKNSKAMRKEGDTVYWILDNKSIAMGFYSQ